MSKRHINARLTKCLLTNLDKPWKYIMDDMQLRSRKVKDYIDSLDEMFQVLHEFGMKLNPLKCSFGVSLGKFLGFIVHAKKIEQVQALKDIKIQETRRKMQSLHGNVETLSRFIFKTMDKRVPFFGALKKEKCKFSWTDECLALFLDLMEHLHKSHVISTLEDLH